MINNLLSNRKIIHLIYLIIVSVLILIVSREQNSSEDSIIALKTLNAQIERNDIIVSKQNAQLLGVFERKAKHCPSQFMEMYSRVNEVNIIFEETLESLERYKEGLMGNSKGFMVLSERQKIVNLIEQYKSNLIAWMQKEGINYQLIINEVKRINIYESSIENDNNRHFIARISLIQSNIRAIENQVLSNLMGLFENRLSFRSFRAIVVPEKIAFFPNENFKGRIVVGRLDTSIEPIEVVVNEQKINPSDFRGNIVNLDFPVGDLGENDIRGKLMFFENGYPVEVAIESSYTVFPRPKNN